MTMNKAILYSMSMMGMGSMDFSSPVVDSILNGSGKPLQNGKPKQTFKQNRRKELTASRKKRNKQF